MSRCTSTATADIVAVTADLRARMDRAAARGAGDLPRPPTGPADAWWQPARLGGSAPTPDEAAALDRHERRERIEAAKKARDEAAAPVGRRRVGVTDDRCRRSALRDSLCRGERQLDAAADDGQRAAGPPVRPGRRSSRASADVDTVVLLVSEVVTNAVLHARSDIRLGRRGPGRHCSRRGVRRLPAAAADAPVPRRVGDRSRTAPARPARADLGGRAGVSATATARSCGSRSGPGRRRLGVLRGRPARGRAAP